ADDGPPLELGASLRDALAALLAAPDARLTVVSDGRPVGVLTVEGVHARLRSESAAPSAS
ncbi:MAG TPA: hypothetical protein VGR12_06045, partial [Solirubrobacteraceae bacterium]|nr:hypothetical protein [Solirubrobacteraceae bacterium]